MSNRKRGAAANVAPPTPDKIDLVTDEEHENNVLDARYRADVPLEEHQPFNELDALCSFYVDRVENVSKEGDRGDSFKLLWDDNPYCTFMDYHHALIVRCKTGGYLIYTTVGHARHALHNSVHVNRPYKYWVNWPNHTGWITTPGTTLVGSRPYVVCTPAYKEMHSELTNKDKCYDMPKRVGA